MNEAELLALLRRLGISYERVEHPAVYTYEEAEALVPPLAGVHTKNLFVRDAKGRRHFLVVVGSQARVDLQALARTLGVSKLGMASPERLLKHLGVTPGAVTLLGIVNADAGAVEVVVDQSVWHSAEPLHCHPLVNTATLAIGIDGLQRLFEHCRQDWSVLDVPCRQADGGPPTSDPTSPL
ncbi:MAG TPA: prolyl-tRNA synthetase associated domain-containing protein [Candidatus Latescibacteria bacterium]|jgi:Ala-tRNA(Pro) deacylase|nr:aminoacyl-tRNA deacylase [Gemmatimonadaceae bacterium]MDP6015655.1 prolyl-tRNA synthetase associated domain-containing protein [Candidatus Latescibacterota bacterium]HJP31938.1 prolyl-tRNA synthetase associated domain-containing protein [Candidatus Latescibacterota bacterium]|tara:strand:+ start:1237 stop:1779 length:543 start_codon:yes stop_codon:yes gene_type:complete